MSAAAATRGVHPIDRWKQDATWKSLGDVRRGAFSLGKWTK